MEIVREEITRLVDAWNMFAAEDQNSRSQTDIHPPLAMQTFVTDYLVPLLASDLYKNYGRDDLYIRFIPVLFHFAQFCAKLNPPLLHVNLTPCGCLTSAVDQFLSSLPD